MKPSITIPIIVAIIFAGAGFFAGMQYQKSKAPSFAGRMGSGQFGAGQGVRVAGNYRPISGVISSVDDQTLTVKLDDGSSKIIILSEKTEINKAETIDKSGLVADIRVMVVGTENSDGSLTAANIQLNPRQFIGTTPTPNDK